MRLERFKRATGIAKRAVSALVAGSIALASSTALAADKYVLEEVDETEVELGTGWYIRGDIGLNVSGTERKGKVADENAPEFAYKEDVGTGLLVGGAVGYRFAPKLRGDLSFSYFSNEDSERVRLTNASRCPGQVNETRTVGYVVTPAVPAVPGIDPVPGYLDPLTGIYVPGTPGVVGTPAIPESRTPIRETGWFNTDIENCSEHDKIEHDAQLFQANVVYDFHPMGRITPFVGAGVGVARVNYSRRTNVTCIPENESYRCVNRDDPFPRSGTEDNPLGILEPGQAFDRDVLVSSGTSYHLAASVQAGVSYQLSRNTHIDASYAYTHILNTPLLDANEGLDGADIDGSLHAFKIGLRYDLW